ncbi:hypothetical protein [Novosphingobium sp. Rr 2-17]|nr:hypothetical protein [Novosphingobium sp. Rr 2-17]
MGLPLGLATQIDMRIGIYHPHGRKECSVEIIAFDCRLHAEPGVAF